MLIIIYNCRILLYYEDVSFDNRFCGFFSGSMNCKWNLKKQNERHTKDFIGGVLGQEGGIST